MAHDVFISYAKKDKLAADAVCAKLEGRGIRCWIAPRDILPGMDWGASIIDALESARVMVLVFSSHANASLQIKHEVERAFSKEILVVPLRIEDVPPGKSLEYFLGNIHWLDAITPPFEQHLDHIGDTIDRILVRPMPPAGGGPARRTDTASMQSEAAAREKAQRETPAREQAAAAERDQASQPTAEAAKEKPRRWNRWAPAIAGLIAIAFIGIAGAYYYNNVYLPQQHEAAEAQAKAQQEEQAREQAARAEAEKAKAEAKAEAARAEAIAKTERQLQETEEQARQKHAGDPAALCYNSFARKDYVEALPPCLKAAAQGNANAQNNLGDMYEQGWGVERDFTDALKWYRKAAAQGQAYGQLNVGIMYRLGLGVEQDNAQALIWCRKAAAQGNATAQKIVNELSPSGW